MTVAVLLAMIPAFLFLRDKPADIGLQPFGDDGSAEAAEAELVEAAEGATLRQATRTRDFWLLAGSFFVCGYTSNGLIGTHLLPHAVEHGFSPATAASAIGLMGMMNVVGTLASGWLTDRYDNRKLLAMYYTLPGAVDRLPAGHPGGARAVPVRDRLRARLDRDRAPDGQPHRAGSTGGRIWARSTAGSSART